MNTSYGDSTRCVHAGRPRPAPGEPFLAGPTFASTYALDPDRGPVAGTDSYGRPDSGTRRRLEAAIGELEGGDCLTFASGMAAISAVLLALVRPGQRIMLPADGYYKTRAWAVEELVPRGIQVVLAPTAGPYPSFDGIRLVLLETPANPGLDVCNIAVLAGAAHKAGALVAVDNTTATPIGQTPLDHNADLVVASATKALTGHSDMLLGYVATRDPSLLATLRGWRDSTGAIPGDFEARQPRSGRWARWICASRARTRTRPPSPTRCACTPRSGRCAGPVSTPIRPMWSLSSRCAASPAW